MQLMLIPSIKAENKMFNVQHLFLDCKANFTKSFVLFGDFLFYKANIKPYNNIASLHLHGMISSR